MCFQESEEILKELTEKNEPRIKSEKPKLAILQVEAHNFKEIINSSRPVMIDVYTDWCGPCKHLAVIMKELVQEYGDVYQFAKLNAEKEKALAKSLGIRVYPTILFFKDGVEVGRLKGYMGKDNLIAKMEKLFH